MKLEMTLFLKIYSLTKIESFDGGQRVPKCASALVGNHASKISNVNTKVPLYYCISIEN